MKYITYADLQDSGACAGELQKFQELFGMKAKVSRWNLRKALKHGLSVAFLRELLCFDERKFSDPVMAEWDSEANALDDRWESGEIDEDQYDLENNEMYKHYNKLLAKAVYEDIRRAG